MPIVAKGKKISAVSTWGHLNTMAAINLNCLRFFLTATRCAQTTLYILWISFFSFHHLFSQENRVQENHAPDAAVTENALYLDSRATAAFQRLCFHKKGIMPHLPVEVRMRRVGSVEQQVSITPQGIATVHITFSYQAADDPYKGKNQEIPCTIQKSFSLSEFSEGKSCRYEVNPNLNAIVLYSSTTPCYIAFKSKHDFEQGIKIFSVLVNQAAHLHVGQPDTKLACEATPLSNIGVQWLVVAPRFENIEEIFLQISTCRKFSTNKYVTWLTKHDPIKNREALLQEGNNISPLFVYPVSVLDDGQFHTLPYIGAHDLALFSTPFQSQSISSFERQELALYAKKNAFIPIILQMHSFLPLPKYILSCMSDIQNITKQISHLPQSHVVPEQVEIIPITPQFYFPQAPKGSTLKWLSGISPTSDDCLRNIFFNRTLSKQEALMQLYREFPLLHVILNEKSKIRKEKTLFESILESLDSIQKNAQRNASLLSEQDVYATQRIELATFLASEAALLFGSPSSISLNGMPYLLIILEKLGASWEENITLEQALIDFENEAHIVKKDMLQTSSSSSSSCTGKNGQTPTVCEIFLQENICAQTHGVPFHIWLKTKLRFLTCLNSISSFSHTAAKSFHAISNLMTALPKALQEGTITLPNPCKLPYHEVYERPLFSAYYLEKKDVPRHRDGLALKKLKEKYDAHILKQSNNKWKDRFWQWLDDKELSQEIRTLPSTIYVNDEERIKYRARFENGVIVAPQELAQEKSVEAIFVIGLDNILYLWKKIDAATPQELSFNHASFFSGAPIASAGKLTMENGKIVFINDQSGHYRSTRQDLILVLQYLKRQGVDIAKCSILNSTSDDGRKVWHSGEALLQEYDTLKKI